MGSSVQSFGGQATGNDSGDAALQQARNELKQTIAETAERLGLGERARPVQESETALEARIEIAKLREMLSTQEQATLRALGSTRDYQNQLKDAAGEVARLQTQLKIALAAADTARVSPPDSQFAQSQLLRIQKDLQRERAARQSENEQSTEKIAKLETAVAQATEELSHRKPSAALKLPLAIVSAALVAGLLSGAGIFFFLRHGAGPTDAASSEPVAGLISTPSRDSASMPVRRSSNWTPSKESAPMKGQPEFTHSVDRLTRALGAFPGQDPQAVLLQVSLKRSTSQKRVCSFDWKDGQPALVFGKGATGDNSLSSAITECAEAVEQFR